MAKKTSQKRLTIPIDLWDSAHFFEFDRKNFGFFKSNASNDSRVIILPRNTEKVSRLEFIGKCTFDEKHRFFVPKNVDAYLGEGNDYYFSTSLTVSTNSIYIYKIDFSDLKSRQNYHLQRLLEALD